MIFVPSGAQGFKKDVEQSRLEIKFVDAGRFAIETNERLFAEAIGTFLCTFVGKAHGQH